MVVITEEDRALYRRLDHCLSARIPGLNRSSLKSLHQRSLVTASPGGVPELKKLPPAGTRISVRIPPAEDEPSPEDLPLEILFEDRHLLVANKEAGMVTHPSPGHPGGTLVNAVLHHAPEVQDAGGPGRPGIVHRLDRGTSGAVVVAKTPECREALVRLFASRAVERRYLGIAMGRVPPEGTLRSPIGRDPRNRLRMSALGEGRPAVTRHRTLEDFGTCLLLELRLETGRTHQIRAQLSQLLGAPIAMDPLYGRPRSHLARLPEGVRELLADYPHPLLHAETLGFNHPATGERVLCRARPPAIFTKALGLLGEHAPGLRA